MSSGNPDLSQEDVY
ncbi:unnamed protein product, partial [Didymodactylos carnosus]